MTRLFSYTELMSLLCGQQYVKPADLVKLLKFERFSTTSTFPGRFRELLSSFSSEDCKRFLVFITAQSALPVNKTIDIRWEACEYVWRGCVS
jgi:HECT-domain (ubiquitin-transferase)